MNCADCGYCRKYKGRYAVRYHYQCVHPDQDKIRDYYERHRIHSAPGYLGASISAENLELKRKMVPKWCPFESQKEREVEISG